MTVVDLWFNVLHFHLKFIRFQGAVDTVHSHIYSLQYHPPDHDHDYHLYHQQCHHLCFSAQQDVEHAIIHVGVRILNTCMSQSLPPALQKRERILSFSISCLRQVLTAALQQDSILFSILRDNKKDKIILTLVKYTHKPPFNVYNTAPAIFLILKCTNQVFLQYRLVKYRENTNRYQTKYRIGIQELYPSETSFFNHKSPTRSYE